MNIYKRFFLLTMLAVSLNSFSQTMDSLSKYSYFMYGHTKEMGINENGNPQILSKIATVFFIRKNAQLYMVSTAHSLSGLGYDKKFELNFPDTLYLRLYKKNSPIAYDLKFSITDIKRAIGSNYYQDYTDLYFYPMNLPDFEINSIEKFISAYDITSNKVDEAFFYGFAAKDGGEQTSCILDPSTMGKIMFEGNNKLLNNIYRIKCGTVQYGYSGSPLFLKTSESKIILGGVAVSGIAHDPNFIIFVPSSFIVDFMNK